MIKKIAIAALILFIVGAVGSLLTHHNTVKTMALEKTIPQSFNGLDVNAGNENIEIIPTNEAVAKVKLTGEQSADFKQNYTINVRGNTLYINLSEHQVKFYNFHVSIFKPLALKIYLPEKQFSTLMIHNDNGEIRTGNLKVADMKLSTNNGVINLNNMSATNADIHSDNGSITFQGKITGKMTGKTDNGKISLVVPSIDHPIQLESDNGSIAIQTSREPDNVTYNVHVDNGKINIFNKYTESAVVGNGDNLITLKTNNGEISIMK